MGAAVAVAAACALGGCGGSGDEPSPPAREGRATDRAATDAAYAFLDAHTTEDGRVQRPDQGGDTVGEGQAYGLLAAAAVGDERRFDRIWAWTRANVERDDGLLAFRWADGRVVDPQAAADADLDAARALLVAACRFDRPELRDAAERIGRATLRRQTARSRDALVLLAGPWASQAGRLTVNPSYLDPTALLALGAATGDPRFARVARDNRALVDRLADPLPPDWAVVDAASGRAAPVAGAAETTGPGRYTFDAPRTLVRLAIDPDPAGRSIAARAWPVFADRRPEEIVVEHELDGRPAGRTRNAVAQVAAAGAATAAGEEAKAARLLDAAQAVQREQPSYYGAAWVALGRLMLTTDRLRPCAPPAR